MWKRNQPGHYACCVATASRGSKPSPGCERQCSVRPRSMGVLQRGCHRATPAPGSSSPARRWALLCGREPTTWPRRWMRCPEPPPHPRPWVPWSQGDTRTGRDSTPWPTRLRTDDVVEPSSARAARPSSRRSGWVRRPQNLTSGAGGPNESAARLRYETSGMVLVSPVDPRSRLPHTPVAGSRYSCDLVHHRRGTSRALYKVPASRLTDAGNRTAHPDRRCPGDLAGALVCRCGRGDVAPLGWRVRPSASGPSRGPRFLGRPLGGMGSMSHRG